jgi:integrase
MPTNSQSLVLSGVSGLLFWSTSYLIIKQVLFMESIVQSPISGDLPLIIDNRWDQLKDLVLHSVTAPSSKRVYSHALDTFYEWYFREARPAFCKAVVQEYRSALQARRHSASTIGLYLSAIRKLAVEAADNGLLDPQVAAAVSRVRSPKRLGRRIGNWLNDSEAATLINAPEDQTRKGVRDQAILAVSIGCGLRRGEIAALEVDHLKLRDERWVIADLVGKHGRIRTVPIPVWVKNRLDVWLQRANIEAGRVFRPINKADVMNGEKVTSQAVYEVIKTYGCRLSFAIAPHDLRRTFAKLAHASGAPLEQIQYSLGHGSLTTTERYLGLKQDLKNSPGDRIQLPLLKAEPVPRTETEENGALVH